MNMLHFIMWSDAETKRRNAEETIEELQERIDKAIEYIENNSCGDLAITFGKDLLEILKGSDKE